MQNSHFVIKREISIDEIMYSSIFSVFMCDLKSIFEIGGQTRLVDTSLAAKFAIINRINENPLEFILFFFYFELMQTIQYYVHSIIEM